jgi:hypothetical protein
MEECLQMTRDLAALKEIQDTFSNPKLIRNHRGQLAAALRVVEPSTRMLLACDYVEHVTWIYEEITHDDGRIRAAIRTTRRFLKGIASIHDVAQARSTVWKLFSVPQDSLLEGANIAREVGLATVTAIHVCCQPQLEEANYVIHDKQTGAETVAFRASYAAALHAAGRDWDANDEVLRNIARKRGREASDKETVSEAILAINPDPMILNYTPSFLLRGVDLVIYCSQVGVTD